jgi:hypothetical protein
MSQTQAAGQVSGKMFLYERPELLSREMHGEYGINPPQRPYEFCAKVRAIPLVLGEFGMAARSYPIIFHQTKEMIPLAVVGIIDDINLFVDDNGNWEQEAYCPAYVRRYPFAIASESGGDRLAIVVDMAFPWLAPGGQSPFFTNGEPTSATQQMIEFCKGYESDRRVTVDMLQQLEGYDLVAPQQAQYQHPSTNETVAFANYFGVDEEKLRNLPDDKFIEMRRSGLLAIVHAQLWSMANWRLLMQRRMTRYNLTIDQVLNPMRLS